MKKNNFSEAAQFVLRVCKRFAKRIVKIICAIAFLLLAFCSIAWGLSFILPSSRGLLMTSLLATVILIVTIVEEWDLYKSEQEANKAEDKKKPS